MTRFVEINLQSGVLVEIYILYVQYFLTVTDKIVE